MPNLSILPAVRKPETHEEDILASGAGPHLLRWIEACRRAWRAVPDDEGAPLGPAVITVATVLHGLGRLHQGVLWACNTFIAAAAGDMSVSTVQRVLSLLEDAGLIRRLRGDTAYWTAHAYGGRLRDSRFRTIVLAFWSPKVARYYWEAHALQKELARGGPLRDASMPGRVIRDASASNLPRRVNRCQGDILNPLQRGGVGTAPSGRVPPPPPSPAPSCIPRPEPPPSVPRKVLAPGEGEAATRYLAGTHTKLDRVLLACTWRIDAQNLAAVGMPATAGSSTCLFYAKRAARALAEDTPPPRV